MAQTTQPRDIDGAVFRDGTATLLARVVDSDGHPLASAAVNSARYTISELDEAGSETVVPGHENVTVIPGDCLYAVLQRDILWTADRQGYNFRHEIDVSVNPAFSEAGKFYRVEFRLLPTAGQIIIVRFRLRAI